MTCSVEIASVDDRKRRAYRRREPEKTLLYQFFQQHVETFKRRGPRRVYPCDLHAASPPRASGGVDPKATRSPGNLPGVLVPGAALRHLVVPTPPRRKHPPKAHVSQDDPLAQPP